MVKHVGAEYGFEYTGQISPVQSEYILWAMAPVTLEMNNQQWQLIGMKEDGSWTFFDYIGRMDEIGQMVIDLNVRDKR